MRGWRYRELGHVVEFALVSRTSSACLPWAYTGTRHAFRQMSRQMSRLLTRNAMLNLT